MHRRKSSRDSLKPKNHNVVPKSDGCTYLRISPQGYLLLLLLYERTERTGLLGTSEATSLDEQQWRFILPFRMCIIAEFRGGIASSLGV